ncbi:hypothetical protein DESUT3_05040 [Desulfuromonas versatilis]|uniref:3D (Asp-Asp-Asp) domain-containing protein n=1 Tax=Desulfuromonas versatilis TaxID=2802975 RepID=A0ABN6DTH5_9BACT|nr:3D domain-containing protein [Desulfuromonas versatilis]BCR03435.1 hypothetical protein DESUT3_05040 [Desulfuromonas versatilis]
MSSFLLWARIAPVLVLLVALLAFPAPVIGQQARTLKVTATAYVSSTDPARKVGNRTAWGDVLVPGMKAIAVSEDLLELGLTRGTRVRIRGLEGEYEVMDRMAPRWKRHIDVYMGENLKAARRWGKRKVTIEWNPVGKAAPEPAGEAN